MSQQLQTKKSQESIFRPCNFRSIKLPATHHRTPWNSRYRPRFEFEPVDCLVVYPFYSQYILDVFWPWLQNPIEPMLGYHRVSSEYLSFFFRPAGISCIQFEFMMTYSIFATKGNIHAAVFVKGFVTLLRTIPTK